MHPLVGFGEELRRLRELTERVAAEEPSVAYFCGTMIELPRACIRADEIAGIADFFSFGTNDLTQTAPRLLARRRRGQVPDVLPRTRRARAEPVRDARSRRRRRPDADRRGAGRASPISSSASAASTAASRARWRSATSSASTTSAARPTACRSPASRRRRPRSPRGWSRSPSGLKPENDEEPRRRGSLCALRRHRTESNRPRRALQARASPLGHGVTRVGRFVPTPYVLLAAYGLELSLAVG